MCRRELQLRRSGLWLHHCTIWLCGCGLRATALSAPVPHATFRMVVMQEVPQVDTFHLQTRLQNPDTEQQNAINDQIVRAGMSNKTHTDMHQTTQHR